MEQRGHNSITADNAVIQQTQSTPGLNGDDHNQGDIEDYDDNVNEKQ